MLWRGPPGVFEDVVRPRLLAPSAELMLDALPPLVPQMRFLEVQAGGGVVSRPLVERIAGLGRLVSVDDDGALASTLPAAPRRAARAVAEALSLPFSDGSFDVVMGNLVLGRSASHDAALLSEVARVTKSAGTFITAVLVAGSFEALVQIASEVADARGENDLKSALGVAADRLPTVPSVLTRLTQAGLKPAHAGTTEQLLGLYRGDEVRADPLLVSVILAGLIDGIGDSDALNEALTRIAPALAQTVDGWFSDGMPVVAHTVIVSSRAERRRS